MLQKKILTFIASSSHNTYITLKAKLCTSDIIHDKNIFSLRKIIYFHVPRRLRDNCYSDTTGNAAF